jgi:hypothetical protein
MKAPGKALLMVTSILFIVFSCIALFGTYMIFCAISLFGASNVYTYPLFIYLFLFCAAEFVMGIVGLILCGNPSKAKFFIVSGAIICILGGIHIVFGIVEGTFKITDLTGFVLPILFIVGGNKNKEAWQQSSTTAISE